MQAASSFHLAICETPKDTEEFAEVTIPKLECSESMAMACVRQTYYLRQMGGGGGVRIRDLRRKQQVHTETPDRLVKLYL
jgi:hypothetical protein